MSVKRHETEDFTFLSPCIVRATEGYIAVPSYGRASAQPLIAQGFMAQSPRRNW